ncbi:SAG family member [Eimeria tenella]|nr:SAG family member [Eimeria tenella]CDJ41995.1 SAG family member [Eimeria tenella]|eukprot:XP_013232745.1 SAG family member [Eimeria tenella]
MIRLVIVSLAAVLAFCEHGTASAATTGKAETLDCLTEMNEARAAAGLAGFEKAAKEGQVLPEYSTEERQIVASDLWNEICQNLVGEESKPKETLKLVGTPAHYLGEKNCEAAVEYWNEGFSLFKNEIPPAYTASSSRDVYNDKAVSFVALYSPKESPVASCAFVTCTTPGANATAPPAQPEDPDSGPSRSLQEESKITTAVMCLINPEALDPNEAPFTEDEWKKIVRALGSSGISPVTPSLTLGVILATFAYGLV